MDFLQVEYFLKVSPVTTDFWVPQQHDAGSCQTEGHQLVGYDVVQIPKRVELIPIVQSAMREANCTEYDILQVT